MAATRSSLENTIDGCLRDACADESINRLQRDGRALSLRQLGNVERLGKNANEVEAFLRTKVSTPDFMSNLQKESHSRNGIHFRQANTLQR